MQKHVIILDMDGTLLTSSHTSFNTSAISVLKDLKNKGHVIVIATGRSLGMVTPIIEKENLEWLFNYIAPNNGSYLYDTSKKQNIYSSSIDSSISFNLLSESKKHDSVICAHTDSGLFSCVTNAGPSSEPSDVAHALKGSYVSPDELTHFIDSNTISQISLRLGDINLLTSLKDVYLNNHSISAVIANSEWLDLNPKGISKSSIIDWLSKIEDVNLSNFISFGDSGNDLSMIKKSSIGVAMGNATKELKDASNVVIGDNDSNAIATFLGEFFE